MNDDSENKSIIARIFSAVTDSTHDAEKARKLDQDRARETAEDAKEIGAFAGQGNNVLTQMAVDGHGNPLLVVDMGATTPDAAARIRHDIETQMTRLGGGTGFAPQVIFLNAQNPQHVQEADLGALAPANTPDARDKSKELDQRGLS